MSAGARATSSFRVERATTMPRALKKAESVLAEARAGKDFAELAKKYSDRLTANEGGELGFVEKKDFAGPIGDTLFAMKVGDVVGAGEVAVRLSHPQARGDPGRRSASPSRTCAPNSIRSTASDRAAELFGERQEADRRSASRRARPISTSSRRASVSRAARSRNSCAAAAPSRSARASICSRPCSATRRSTRARSAARWRSAKTASCVVKVTAHQQSRGQAAGRRARRNRRAAQAGARRRRRQGGGRSGARETRRPARSSTRWPDAQRDRRSPRVSSSRGDPSIPAALRTAIFEAPRPDAKPVDPDRRRSMMARPRSSS